MTASAQFGLVAPGIYRAAVDMAPPLHSANVYLLLDGGEGILVDTGWVGDGDWSHVATLLRYAGLVPAQVRTVVATHSHVDHVGHGRSIRSAWGISATMHPLEATTRSWAEPIHRDVLATWLARHGVPEGFLDSSISELTAIAPPELDPCPILDGETIAIGATNWLVLHTPGHTPGHLCLFRESDRVLIGGDHLLEGVSPNVGAFPFQPPDPLGGYLRSLRRVAALRPALVLPGHGKPFTDVDAVARGEEAHHMRRLQAVLSALDASPKARSAFEISGAIRWTARERSFAELSGVHRFLAFSEPLSHLELLEVRGEVVRVRSSGQDGWTLAHNASWSSTPT
jgi:glyoxylase-like metal-dependent hydrolase (beta-lactamase superfamily II)